METKMITQKEYDKFYDGIMEYVRNKELIYRGKKAYSRPPGPGWLLNRIKNKFHKNDCDDLEPEEKYVNLPGSDEELVIEHEISLSEKEFGHFIDRHFKFAIIQAMMRDDRQKTDELKKDIALAIKKYYNS